MLGLDKVQSRIVFGYVKKEEDAQTLYPRRDRMKHPVQRVSRY